MQKLVEYVQRLAESHEWDWVEEGDRLVLSVGARHQEVRFARQGVDYVFTTVVLGSARVTRDARRWRDLARLVWRRNAEHEIVTFAFDRRDRLIGRIRHPADHLDYEELEIYVTALARECDRFEYLLTGRDDF